jgi:hypothetical protein
LNKIPIGLSAIGLIAVHETAAIKVNNNHSTEWNPII